MIFNRTIFSLCASSLSSSPFFATTHSSFTGFRLQVSKSFQSFLRVSGSPSSVIIRKSSFTNFLDSAIYFDSVRYYHQTFTEQFIPGPEDTISFQECSFSGCHSANNGGGFFFNPGGIGSICEVNLSSFHFCSSNIGGAFMTISDSYNVNRNCFTECVALSSNHAFLCISTYTHSNPIHFFSLNTYIECPGQAARIQAPALGTFTGKDSKVAIMNVTNCYNYDIGTAFVMKDNTGYATGLLITNNYGKCGISLTNSSYLRIFSSSFINNTFTGGLLRVIDTHGSFLALLEMHYTYFNNNIIGREETGSDDFNVNLEEYYLDYSSAYQLFGNHAYDIETSNFDIHITPLNQTHSVNLDCFLEYSPTQQPPPKENSLTLYIIVGASSGVLLGALISYIVYSFNKKRFIEEWLSQTFSGEGSTNSLIN